VQTFINISMSMPFCPH